MGITPVKTAIQINSMDADLRNGLWDALNHYFKKDLSPSLIQYHADIHVLFTLLWHDYFKKPLDTLEDYWPETYNWTRNYFFSCKWYDAYISWSLLQTSILKLK